MRSTIEIGDHKFDIQINFSWADKVCSKEMPKIGLSDIATLLSCDKPPSTYAMWLLIAIEEAGGKITYNELLDILNGENVVFFEWFRQLSYAILGSIFPKKSQGYILIMKTINQLMGGVEPMTSTEKAEKPVKEK